MCGSVAAKLYFSCKSEREDEKKREAEVEKLRKEQPWKLAEAGGATRQRRTVRNHADVVAGIVD